MSTKPHVLQPLISAPANVATSTPPVIISMLSSGLVAKRSLPHNSNKI